MMRKLAEMLQLKGAIRLMDQRAAREKELSVLEDDLADLEDRSVAQTAAIRDMSRQAKLGSYHRVRLGR